jgi:hypothetical protein
VVAVWLRRVVGKFAGMAALFVLTFSPHLVYLSAQVRSYTLELLLVSASLLALDAAIDAGSWRRMVWFDVLLLASVFTEFGVAWFVGAVGIYALMRLRGSPRAVKIAWAAGQAILLVLYAALFITYIRYVPASPTAEVPRATYLSQGFPHRGGMLTFPWTHTLKQSEYLLDSTTLGAFGSAMFAIAVFLLWTGRTRVPRERARALVLLFTVPFVLGMMGAYARVHPYSRSRHTLVIGLFVACGIGIFVESLPRRARLAMLLAPPLMAAVWLRFPDGDQGNLPAGRNRKSQMLQCIAYMHEVIPAGALIITDRETLQLLIYYQGGPWPLPRPLGKFVEVPLGGRWRVAWNSYQFGNTAKYRAALAAFRVQYGIPDPQPVWVLDGGWSAVAGPVDPQRPFTRAMRIFQTQ